MGIVINTSEEEIAEHSALEGGAGGADDNPIIEKDQATIDAEATAEAAKLAAESGTGDDGGDGGDGGTVDAIEIDGEEYTLNEKGDAVNTDGTVKYTKTELDAFGDAPAESSATLLAKSTNIIPLDPNGNPIVYADDDAGLSQYVADVYEQGKADTQKEVYSNLYARYPVLQNIVNHLELNNGDLSNFSNNVSYSDVVVDKKDETQMKSIIFAARKARGEDVAKTEKYYSYLKDSDVDMKAVISEANDELGYLKQIEDTETAETQKQLEAKADADATALKDYWGIELNNGKLIDLNKEGSVYKSIKSGTIKLGNETYVIPDKIRIKEGDKVQYKTKDDFFKYLYQNVPQVINGRKVNQSAHMTDLQVEESTRTTGHDIYDAFKRYVKYDNTQFIKEQVNKANVRTITRKITTNANSNTSTNKAKSTGKIVINQ